MATVLDCVVASGRVQDRKLVIRDRRSFDRQIAQLKDTWELEITVQRKRATRSPQANRYWWGVCLHIVSEHTGYTPDEIHDFAKAKFLPKHLVFADGNGEIVGEHVLGGSTRKLNTTEFYLFIEQFRQWAAETLDLNIPDPEPLEAF